MNFNGNCIYGGSESYTSKSTGREITLHRFQDDLGRWIRCTLPIPPTGLNAGDRCHCILEVGTRKEDDGWHDFYRITAAYPINKK